MMFFLWVVAPIAAMIWYGMTVGIFRKIIRKDEFPNLDVLNSVFFASILFGVVIFAIITAILMGAN